MKVGGNGECRTASAAENGFVVPLALRPHDDRMIGKREVAILAGVEKAAAFHLDGDDVGSAVVVEATGLRVKMEAEDVGRGVGHKRSSERRG